MSRAERLVVFAERASEIFVGYRNVQVLSLSFEEAEWLKPVYIPSVLVYLTPG